MARWTRLPEYVHTLVEDSPESVLLQTSRFDASNQHSYLFLDPLRAISANTLDDVPELFSQVEEALAGGLYVAGFFSYECGYHFEKFSLPPLKFQDLPLAWLGVYRRPFIFNHLHGGFEGHAPVPPGNLRAGSSAAQLADSVTLTISEKEYYAALRTIKDYISAGETYQVNFTDRVSFRMPGPAAETFRDLSERQPVAYSALLNIAGCQIHCLSPELFFRIRGGRIVTRPMKGTMPRGLDSLEDAQAALRLKNDEKSRSEHVMIVDLLRNDLGRICTMGSVRVDELFSVEKYRTLFQMTSTISGVLRPRLRFYEVFKSLFPGGSITGAPKIRTMEIIRELERTPRGVYTGAIGFIAPDRSATFNLAIRTLVNKAGIAHMGVGGGIVADSNPQEEHRECLLKAAFLTSPHRKFQLIETMLWDGHFHFLAEHLDRMEASAEYFDFAWERASILARLKSLSATFLEGSKVRVRVLVNADGDVTISDTELQVPRITGYVKISSQRTSSRDPFLRHKTTHRDMYDREYAEAVSEGFDEVVFTNEKGEITEGAINNLFARREGRLLTPPLCSGLLPGIYRRHLLDTHPTMEERPLTLEDLEACEAVFLCNSVRGITEVEQFCIRKEGRAYIGKRVSAL